METTISPGVTERDTEEYFDLKWRKKQDDGEEVHNEGL